MTGRLFCANKSVQDLCKYLNIFFVAMQVTGSFRRQLIMGLWQIQKNLGSGQGHSLKTKSGAGGCDCGKLIWHLEKC